MRRIIEFYRFALMDADPEACAQVDKLMYDCGQDWVIPHDEAIDPERLMTARDISQEFGIAPFNVRDWSRRHPDVIPRRGTYKNRILYRLGDVLKYEAEKRSPKQRPVI